MRSHTVDLGPAGCEKGAGDPQTVWTQDISLARYTGMTESKDFIVQMVEPGPERNNTCPRSHSKWHTEPMHANGTHGGSGLCMCVHVCV